MTGITTNSEIPQHEKRRVARHEAMAVAASDFACWDYDLGNGQVKLSDIWSVILGESRNPTFASIWELTELVPAEDQSMIRAVTVQAVKDRDNRVYQVVHRVKKPNGSVIWIQTEGKVVARDESGRALRMVGLNRDVTERIQSQTALQETNKRIHMLLDYAPAAVALLDRDMRYLAVSRRWLTDYKLEGLHIIGQLHYDIFPDIPGRMKEAYSRGLSGEAVRSEEDKFTLQDGATRWEKWEIRPWRDADNNIGGIVLFTEDITERKKRELTDKAYNDTIFRLKKLGELFVQKNTLEPVLQEIVDIAIEITNADFGTIQLLNSRSESLHIVAQRELPADWLEFWDTVVKGQATCGAALETRERIIDEDIEKSPLYIGTEALAVHLRAGVRALQSTPLISRSGRLLGMFSTYYKTTFRAKEESLLLLDLLALQAADIIERFELERTVRQNHRRNIELNRKQVALQTVSAIAHEINQPLISVANYCATAQRLLATPSPDLDKVRDVLIKSEKQTLRAGETIRGLLSLLQENKVKIKPFDLNVEIRSVAAGAKNEYELKFRTRLNLDKKLPPVLADRFHIRQVLFNLLNNGIEAMRDAGVPTPEIVVRVKTKKDQNVAMVTVQDNGPGFSNEHINQLFEPFYTTKPNGIGMGLVVSRALIEANGGQLWVDPDEGPGAVFHFTIPLAL